MNEVRALIEAFDAAAARGERCAVATVVSVEGSSYRRPGARMLVCEGGTSTGTISAGCLESDVIEHAQRVLRTGEAKLVEYDTASTNDEMAWGLGLGCGGTLRVLVEPLAAGSLYLEALRRSLAGAVSIATVYRSTPPESVPAGARLVLDEEGEEGSVSHEKLSDEMAARLESEVRAPSRGGMTSMEIFLETLLPPVPLIVFGAGHDVLPVVKLAREVGWHTEVVDPQARPASLSRFAMADKVTLSRPQDVEMNVTITPRTMTLLMSHNYVHDLALLGFLLASPARYIGVMGPRDRTERMLRELAPHLGDVDLARLHSPVGLDIGANGPAEIALSIVAEMRAVLDGRSGGMLRERRGSIQGSPSTDQRVLRVVAA
jgi:xanthine dehydrogenase accessory factor